MSLEHLKIAFYIAVFSWIYVNILTDEGMILNWWERWLMRFIHNDFILKPVLTCAYCVAGQIALWAYVFLWHYNLLEHVIFISITIFLVHLINRIDR